MTGEKLLCLMGEVDDKFIEELDIKTKPRRPSIKKIMLAASILIIVALGLIISNFQKSQIAKEIDSIPNNTIISEEITDIKPDENLPKLAISDVIGDGMGYAGVSIKDIEDLDDGNPWRPEWNLSALPVFKNDDYFSKGFVVEDYTIDEMKADLIKLAKMYGFEVSSDEIIVIPYDEYELSEFGKPAINLASNVICEADGYEFYVGRGRNFSVRFNDETSIYTSEVLGIDDGYNMTEDEIYKLADFIIEKYPYTLNLEKPKVSIYNRNYTFEGEQWLRFKFYEDDDNLLNEFLNHQIGLKVEVTVNHVGNITSIYYSGISDKKLVGNYPLISPEKAIEKMDKGDFITTVPYDFPGVEEIKKVKLMYMTNSYQEYLMPYYEVYVLVPEEVEDRASQGLTPLGIYYVPAIEEEYLEKMPVYEGQFN